nr:hypothetical protein [Nostoc favosum]
MLEDNRPSRGGSETWHFTLNLWYKRQDTAANIQKFDWEWESRHKQDLRNWHRRSLNYSTFVLYN